MANLADRHTLYFCRLSVLRLADTKEYLHRHHCGVSRCVGGLELGLPCIKQKKWSRLQLILIVHSYLLSCASYSDHSQCDISVTIFCNLVSIGTTYSHPEYHNLA